jgi:uncharacterized protein (TIGR00255 family)
MTGFGEAHLERDGARVSVEVRSINNRYFKLALKCSEGYGALEGEIETVVRGQCRRGTIQVNVRVERPRSPDEYHLNLSVLDHYHRRLAAAYPGAPVPVESLLQLPGVIEEPAAPTDLATRDWPVIAEALRAALEQLARMRRTEGAAMAADLEANRRTIATELAGVEARAPHVAAGYRVRLAERIRRALEEHDVAVQPADLLRDVSIFAERSDVSEEVVRLRSHLEQFDGMLKLTEGAGRKLEFLVQEMSREANTVGSKSGDVEISKHVIEIKASLERIREMIQNVE